MVILYIYIYLHKYIKIYIHTYIPGAQLTLVLIGVKRPCFGGKRPSTNRGLLRVPGIYDDPCRNTDGQIRANAGAGYTKWCNEGRGVDLRKGGKAACWTIGSLDGYVVNNHGDPKSSNLGSTVSPLTWGTLTEQTVCPWKMNGWKWKLICDGLFSGAFALSFRVY